MVLVHWCHKEKENTEQKESKKEIQMLKSAIKQLSFQRDNNRMFCGWMWNSLHL